MLTQLRFRYGVQPVPRETGPLHHVQGARGLRRLLASSAPLPRPGHCGKGAGAVMGLDGLGEWGDGVIWLGGGSLKAVAAAKVLVP